MPRAPTSVSATCHGLYDPDDDIPQSDNHRAPGSRASQKRNLARRFDIDRGRGCVARKRARPYRRGSAGTSRPDARACECAGRRDPSRRAPVRRFARAPDTSQCTHAIKLSSGTASIVDARSTEPASPTTCEQSATMRSHGAYDRRLCADVRELAAPMPGQASWRQLGHGTRLGLSWGGRRDPQQSRSAQVPGGPCPSECELEPIALREPA
jgi:hypothetical protein